MAKLSKKTLATIDKGMEQSQEGKVVDRGTFSNQTRIGIRGLDKELYRQARLKAVSLNINVAVVINDALREYFGKS